MSKKKSNVEDIYNYMRNFFPTLGLEALSKIPEKKVYENAKDLKPPRSSITKTITFDKQTKFEDIVSFFQGLRIEKDLLDVRLNYEKIGEKIVHSERNYYQDHYSDDIDDDVDDDVHDDDECSYTVPVYGDCISIEMNFNVSNPNYKAELAEHNHRLRSKEDKNLNITKHNERVVFLIEENKRKINSAIHNHKEIWTSCARAISNGSTPVEYVDSRIKALEEELDRLKVLKAEKE